MGNQGQLTDQDRKSLESSFLRWMEMRKHTVHTLRVLADKLMLHHNNVCIAQVAGNSASIAGFGFMAAGFGLSFVTGGLSLALTGFGTAINMAGGITNGGSAIAESCIKKDTFDNIQRIIEEDRKALEALRERWKELEGKTNTGQEVEMSEIGLVGCKFAFMLKNCASTVYKLGVAVGKTGSITGGEAVFRGLNALGKTAHIGVFAVGAAFLPVDIYNLVQNAKKVDKSRKGQTDHEPEEVKAVRELAENLAKEIPNEKELDEMIEDLIKARQSGEIQ